MTTKNFVVKNGLTTGNILLDATSSNIYGNLVVANLSVPASANLGSAGNVKITGGSSGQVLTTDGTGNLSWATVTSSSGGTVAGSNTQIQFNNSGSFGASANLTFTNTSNTLAVDNITLISTGNLTGGNLVSASYLTGTLTTQNQPNITSVGTLTNTTIAANANLTLSGSLSRLSGANLISAGYFSGNGALLVTLTGANVAGQVGNALVAGTVYTNAQPNITSLGTLSSVTISGTTNLGAVSNVTVTGGTSGQFLSTDGTGNLSWATVSSGTSTAVNVDNFTGDGSTKTFTLTTSPASVNNVIVNYNGAIIARASYSVSGTTLTFGSAPALGSSLEVTTIAGLSTGPTANISFGNVTVSGNVTAAYLIGNGSQLTGLPAGYTNSNVSSYLSTATISTTGNLTSNTATANTLTVSVGANFSSASTVTMGPIGNVKITGGTKNQYMQTDGTGNLSFSDIIHPFLFTGF